MDGKHVVERDSRALNAAAASYRGLVYQSMDDDLIELPDAVSAGVGEDTTEDIGKALCSILQEAGKNGLSPNGQRCLQQAMTQFSNIFRIKMGSDPPARVAPLVVTLAKNARPHRSPKRS